MVVCATVVFNLEGQRWTHDFDVERGSTVWQLKELMVHPEGTREDVESFELQLLGRRVPDTEKICQPYTFDFEFLGPAEGKRRAQNEARELEAWERQRAEEEAARLRRPKPAAQEAPAAGAAHKQEATPFDSKPVVKTLPPLPDGQHEITVTIDRGMDLKTVVTVSGGAVILNVKEQLSAQDPTGSMNVATFGLGIAVEGEEAARAVPDGTVLTERHLHLEITEPWEESPEEAASRPMAYTPAPRPPAEPAPPMLPRWEVVGGADKGGILVREGQATTSTQLPQRLATGAIVNELRIEGERLQYQKLWGEGPDTGWVSLALSGRELLVRREPSVEELFTLDRALSLQEDLLEGFAQPEFQRALDDIAAEFPEGKGFKFQKKRNELILAVQSQVLPKYGFEGGPGGVHRMMKAFDQHPTQEVGWNANEINRLLRL